MTTSPVIGIDFGGTSVKMAVVSGENLLTEIQRIPTQDFDHPDLLIDAIVEAIAAVRVSHPDIAAIGIGVPGAVNFYTGMTYNLTNVKGWTAVPLRDMVAEALSETTLIDSRLARTVAALAVWSAMQRTG